MSCGGLGCAARPPQGFSIHFSNSQLYNNQQSRSRRVDRFQEKDP
jgi:hypothetical protein